MMGRLHLPTLLDLVRELEGQEVVLGLFLAGAGLVFMIFGLRIFSVVVAVSFGALGFMLGWILPVSELMQWVCGVLGAVGLAVASMQVIKLSVAVLAGGWSGYVLVGLSTRFGLSEQTALVLGGVALAIAISLAFIMYHETIALITSFEGALLFLGGLVVCFSRSLFLWNHLRSMVVENPIFGPFLVLAGTVTGFYLQLADLRQKQAGTTG